jgi:hypothetical protein
MKTAWKSHLMYMSVMWPWAGLVTRVQEEISAEKDVYRKKCYRGDEKLLLL